MTLKTVPQDNGSIFLGSLIFGCIILGIYIPFSLYCAWQVYSRHTNIIFQKRHNRITTHLIILTIMNEITLIGLFIVSGLYEEAWITIYLQNLLASEMITYFWIVLWRLWIYYYDIQVNLDTQNDSWKKVINNDVGNSFYLKHKKTWGNNKYLNKYIYIVFVVTFAGLILLNAFFPLIDQLYSTLRRIILILMCVIPLLLIIILRWKTPAFEDVFYIKYEIGCFIILALVCAVLLIGIAIAILQNFSDLYNDIFNLVFYGIISTGLLVALIITTILPIKLNKTWLLVSHIDFYAHRAHRNSKLVSLVSLTTPQNLAKAVSLSNDDKPDIKDIANETDTKQDNPNTLQINDAGTKAPMSIRKVLKNPRSFSIFVEYLQSEFSTEVVYSLIEIDQFQRKLASQASRNSKKFFKSKITLQLPSEIPNSNVCYVDILRIFISVD